MPRKIERWLSDVFPGAENIYTAYDALSRREIALVAAGVLDLALAELLEKRLMDSAKECEGFLGLDGDGRAPCGTFGARIQLARLVGILNEEDAAILRSIKAIRNAFAHRINVDFTSEEVVPLVLRLYSQWRTYFEKFHANAFSKSHGIAADELKTIPDAGHGLLLAVFCVYQAYFHQMYDDVTRIEPLNLKPQGNPLLRDDPEDKPTA